MRLRELTNETFELGQSDFQQCYVLVRHVVRQCEACGLKASLTGKCPGCFRSRGKRRQAALRAF